MEGVIATVMSLRGDTIEVFKIINQKYDCAVAPRLGRIWSEGDRNGKVRELDGRDGSLSKSAFIEGGWLV